MNSLINRLIQDHKAMSKVHKCLKSEMQLYVDGDERPNISVLLDIMEYLKSYTEYFHHPLEDRVYGKMRLLIEDPIMQDVLDSIEIQHAQLNVYSKRLQSDYLAISNDQVMPLGRLLSDYRAYIQLAEEHLECENKYLFPVIEQYVSEADLSDIKVEIDSVSDPVFGTQRLATYNDLYAYIMGHEYERRGLLEAI